MAENMFKRFHEPQAQQAKKTEENPFLQFHADELKQQQQPQNMFLQFHQEAGAPAGPTVLPESDTSSDFWRAIANYTPQLKETLGGAEVLLGNVLDNKQMIAAGAARMKAAKPEQVVKESDEFTTAWNKGIGTVLTDWLPYQIGSGVTSLAETLASMGIGAAVGAGAGAGVGAIPGALTGVLGKTLIKKGVKEEAEKILKDQGEEKAQEYIQREAKKALRSYGAEAGIAAQSLTHGAGEVTSRAVEELEKAGGRPDELDMARVAPAAMVHAVADFVSDKIMLGALKGIEGKSSGSFIKDIAKHISLTGTKELVPEEIQSIAERYGAKLSLTDIEALKEYVNTAAASYGMSVVPGGVGGVRTYLSGRTDDMAADQQARFEANAAFTGLTVRPDAAGEVDAETEAALRPVVPDDTNAPVAATSTSTQAPDQPTQVAPTPPSVATLSEAPVVEDDELKAMRQEYADRQAKIEAGGPKQQVDNRIAANDRLAQRIAEKEAQLRTQQAEVLPPSDTSFELPPISVPPAAEAVVQAGVEEGVPDVSGQVDQGAAGAGVPVLSGPEAAGAPAVTAGTEPVGVASSEGFAGELTGGAPEQRAAVEQVTAPEVAPTLTTETAPAVVSAPAPSSIVETPAEAWDNMEDRVPYNQLSKQDRQIWEDAQRDGIATGELANDIVIRTQKNAATERSNQRKAEPEEGGDDYFSLTPLEQEEASALTGRPITDRTDLIRASAGVGRSLASLTKKILSGTALPDWNSFNLQRVKTELNRLVRDTYEPITGPEAVIARASADLRDGNITREVYDTVQTLFNKYPKILDGLRLSIRENKQDTQAAGSFSPLAKIVALYKGTRGVVDPRTFRHEITHSLEQMMSPEAAAKVLESYGKALNRLAKTNPELHAAILTNQKEDSDESFKAVVDLLNRLPKDQFDKGYQLLNPSEFWAVNAESLLASQLGGGWQRFKKGVKGLFESLKDVLGFDNKSSIHKAFADVMAGEMKREGKMLSKQRNYYSAQQQPTQAPATTFRENTLFDNTGYETNTRTPTGSLVKQALFSTAPWRYIARKFQNDRYPIKRWEDLLDLAGKIKFEGEKAMNNIFTQITLSTGRAKNFYHGFIAPIHQRLDKNISEFARDAGITVDEALGALHRLLEALHEEERRRVKFLLTVPLTTAKNFNNGSTSAADRRDQIIKLLDSKRLSPSQAQQLRTELDAIVDAKNPDGSWKYRDPYGSSSRAVTNKDGTRVPLSIEMSDPLYNVLGVSRQALDERVREYEKSAHKAQMDKILADMRELNKITADLNKYSNYWSDFVSNRVAFYGWQNYAPFKGRASFQKNSDVDEWLDFDSPRMGKELQEVAFSLEGRESVADNPVLQTISDAVRAAMRAGRKDLTQSIKNAIEQKLLPGKIKETIKFEDRESDKLKSLRGENTIFHYNEDGTIDILVVEDKLLRDAIRRTYRDTNPYIDTMINAANIATSTLGKMHTRYNYNFPVLNFVRDALTNAWAIGANMGPTEAARFIGEVSANVVLKGGMPKAMKVAYLFDKGDFSQLNALAKKDPTIKDMVEFLQEGGMVSYLQGLSINSNFEELQKKVGRSGIARRKEDVDKFLDVWIGMFEIASRSAAYSIAKRNAETKGASEKEARVRAAAYAKNLANFEQVGEWGRFMGSMYMFFRPSATGAVRAVEAVAPAFRLNVNNLVNQLPEQVRKDPAAVAKFEKDFRMQQKSARVMLAALTGLGFVAYNMAAMMAPDDDDAGRNAVMTDNMDQWTRFARFHIPKEAFGGEKDFIFQIPWGFGLGAFAAAGAQLASVMSGAQPLGTGVLNAGLQIALDSFLPIPVSRMSPTEEPVAFVIDSLFPSVARPAIEWVMNKNGLGQDIYNDANRRMGDAFLGGDKIPEIYKDIAINLANIDAPWAGIKMGDLDPSPNTLYFLSNSYIDGIGRVFEMAYGVKDLAKGAKEFQPKTDLPFVGSFIGAKSDYDTREFAKYEREVKGMERRIRGFETDPQSDLKYQSRYPLDKDIVDYYNSEIGSSLNDLKAEANSIRQDPMLTPKSRSQLLELNKREQNFIKRDMILMFKAYGVKP